MTEPRFCEKCDVTLDLHPWPDDEDDPGCEVALDKARVIDDFMRAVTGRPFAAVVSYPEKGTQP